MCVDRGRVAYLGTTVTGELVKDVAVRLAVIVQVLPDQVDQVVYSVGVRPRLRERGWSTPLRSHSWEICRLAGAITVLDLAPGLWGGIYIQTETVGGSGDVNL